MATADHHDPTPHSSAFARRLILDERSALSFCGDTNERSALVAASPRFDWEIFDLFEVLIPGDYGQPVLLGKRGNPDVVFRQRPSPVS